jgi:hypothetical protein
MSEDEKKESVFWRRLLVFGCSLLACVFTVWLIAGDNFATPSSLLDHYADAFLRASPTHNALVQIARTITIRAIGMTTEQSSDAPILACQSLSFQQRVIANLLMCAFLLWLASLWEKKLYHVLWDFGWLLALLISTQIAALAQNFWLSLILVTILTVVEAIKLLKRVASHKEPSTGQSQKFFITLAEDVSASRPHQIPLWSACFSFASGLVILAGLLPPFDFAQPLHQSATIHKLLDARLLFSLTFLTIFLVSIGVTAFVRVSRNVAVRSKIKATPFNIDNLTKKLPVGNPILERAIRLAFPPPALCLQVLVEASRWTVYIAEETWKVAWEIIFYKYVYRAAAAAFFRLAGLVLIGQTTFAVSSKLISLLRLQTTQPNYIVAEFQLLAWCLLLAALAVFGVYLVVLATLSKVETWFHSYYAGRLLTFALACWVTGAASWAMRKFSPPNTAQGFDHAGAYFLTAPALVLVTYLVLQLTTARGQKRLARLQLKKRGPPV